MPKKRAAYTTELIRADDLTHGDVFRLDGTWFWVGGVWSWSDLEAAADEFGADSSEYRDIAAIVNQVPENGDGVYVAVRYLHTAVSHTRMVSRYNADPPGFKIAAYSQYELIEIQKEN